MSWTEDEAIGIQPDRLQSLTYEDLTTETYEDLASLASDNWVEDDPLE